MAEPVFEAAADQFNSSYYGSVRGHIRREVIRAFLQPQIVTGSVETALDYGGGNADDSAWLAQQDSNLRVDFWDDSPAQVSAAEATILSSSDIEDRVSILTDDPVGSTNQYDLVMLHGVIQYLERDTADQLMDGISKLIESGGILSLATKNAAVVDSVEAEEGVKMWTNRYDLPCIAYSDNYLRKWISSLGFATTPFIRGVRCLYDKDFRELGNVPKDQLEDIVEAEKHESTREDSVETGQMLHVIARKI